MSYLPDINNAKVAGTATDVNSGNKSGGTQRVIIATDQPALTNKLLTTPDLPSGASTDASITETHGTKAAGTAATKSDLVGGVAASAAPAPTNGQQIAMQMDLLGNLRVSPYGNVGSFINKDSGVGAGGVQQVLTVPAGKKWVLKCASILLVASGTAANRQAFLTLTDGTNTICGAVDPQLTTAGQTHRTSFYPGAINAAFVQNNNAVSFPESVLGPGYTLTTVVVNLQAGDTIRLMADVIELSD